MWLYHFTKALHPLFSQYWSWDVRGPGVGRVPDDGPLIVAMNHVSFLDPWFLQQVFPRSLHYLINETWYRRSPIWRFFFDANGTIPVGSEARSTVNILARALERGASIGIFPEGAISPTGSIQRFRPGVARLAAKTGAPVMPVGIRGARESIPKGRHWPRPGPIHLYLGTPYVFPGSPWRGRVPPRDATRVFQRRTFEKICALSGQPVPDLERLRSPRARPRVQAIS